MKIYIFHASAGHGHQRVAEVIEKVFHMRGLSADEVKVEDSLHSTSPFFRWIYPESYYRMVRDHPALWGWFYETFDLPGVYKMIRPFRESINQLEGGRLLKRMRREKPEHILCTHFFTAELFSRAKLKGKIKATVTTVITDFYPHAFWVHPGTDYYWVMNEESETELRRRGVPKEKIRVGGIPVDPAFKPTGRKKELLKKWGFKEDRFTVLFSSGSFGLGPTDKALAELEHYADRVQCFVVCGNNRHLKSRLDKEHFSFPVQVFGFVDFMADLMEASDLMVAKSGGSSTVESLAKDLPMVVFHPIPGQELRNAQFLKSHNASFFMEHPEQIKNILKAIFENPDLIKDKHKMIREIAKPNAADDLVTFILEEERK